MQIVSGKGADADLRVIPNDFIVRCLRINKRLDQWLANQRTGASWSGFPRDQDRAGQISGSIPASRRPVLSELHKALRGRDTLTVVKLDGRGRSVVDVQSLIDALHEKAISVRILNFGVDTVKPSRRLFLALLSDFAEFEGGSVNAV